jgi:hypothetical protein
VELRRYVEARGWTAVEYTDLGVSGPKDKRPALDRLVADAKRRKFDVLVCWRLDRLGHSLKHLITLLDDLQALGVSFVSLAEEIYATGDFKHRVVIFAEADSIPDEGPAGSAVRALAADNQLVYEVVEKKGEKYETRRIQKEGPTGLITTSTKKLPHQMNTRVLEVCVNDSPAQTREIIPRTGSRRTAGRGRCTAGRGAVRGASTTAGPDPRAAHPSGFSTAPDSDSNERVCSTSCSGSGRLRARSWRRLMTTQTPDGCCRQPSAIPPSSQA